MNEMTWTVVRMRLSVVEHLPLQLRIRSLRGCVCVRKKNTRIFMVWIRMDIQIVVGTVKTTARTTCRGFLSAIYKSTSSSSSSFSLSRRHFSSTAPRTICSSQEPPNRNGDSNNDKLSTDWDKAWTKFKKKGKKGIFSQFSPNKYVTWNPRNSNFPLSEEVDPIKRTERSNLKLWTSPQFTLVGAIVIVSFLLLYTILAPVK